MKRNIIYCLIVALLIPIMVAFVHTPQAASEVKKLRIGLLVGLTGWFSAAGTSELDECKTAVEIMNERGGITIKGEKYEIELVPEDMKSSHEGVTAGVNKLIYDKNIKFIVGPTAFWGPASAPLCEANKIINAIGYCTNTPSELDKTTQYRILAENGTMGHVYAMLKYIKKNHSNIKTVVILHPDDGAIPYLKPLMTKVLQENGISVVGDVVSYPNELVDFSPIASKLAARKADAIFNPNAIGQQVGPILKGLRELGDNRWFFYCGVGKCSDIKNIAGAAAKNLVTLAIMPGAPGNPPQLEAWVKKLYAKVGEERSLIVQNSSGTWVLPQILQAAQSLDPTAIKEAMNRIDKVETLWGPGRICGEKTYGIRHAVAHPLPSQFINEKGEIKFGGWMTDIYVP